MTPDFQTSMKIIRESNEAFLTLLESIKAFLTEETQVTISYGSESITLPSLPAVIRAYRGGTFESIAFPGQDTVTLSNDNGALKVAGDDGTLRSLKVLSVIASTITSCTVNNLYVDNCSIDTIRGATLIDVENISVQTLAAATINAGMLVLQGISAQTATVSDLTADKAYIGQMYVVPTNIKNLFFVPGGGAYNYNSANYVFADVSTGGVSYKFWKCTGLSSPAKDPTTYGFYAKPANNAPLSMPDAKALQGDYSLDGTEIDNVGIGALGAYGNNSSITYTNVKFLKTPFNVIQSWPVAIYGTGPTAAGYGMAFLQEFRPSDEGKIFYFRTGGKPWRIARVLSLTYASVTASDPMTASLGSYLEVPAYTCLRLRASRVAATSASGTVEVTNRLELV